VKYLHLDSICNNVVLLLVVLLLLSGCAVNGEEETVITVSPGTAVVTLGDTEQFSVTPAGTTVTWSVNGILGGNEGTVGTVDADGKYTAPSDDDAAPEKVIVRAADTTTGLSSSAIAFLTTFDANKRLTTHYTAGTSKSNTYSSGQKNIAVFKDTGAGVVNVYAVWSDNSSGPYKVYFTKSVDGGSTFDVPVLVDDTSSGEQFSPALAADGNGNIFIVWEDHLQGDSDIFLRKYDSLTGFALQQIKQINPVATDSIDYNTSPSIAISSDEIYITWERRTDPTNDYPDIRFAWSSDLGSTFSAASDLSLSGRRPVVVMDSAGIAYVAWEDLTQFPLSSPTHIKLGKISGGSQVGAALDLEVATGYNARFPSIAVDPVCNTAGDTICEVYIVWQRADITDRKFVSEVTNSYDIDLAIVNGGTLALISTTLSVTDSGSSGFFGGAAYPAIAADDSNIYMVWDDWRNGTKDIYFAKSSDGSVFTTNRIVNDDTDNSSGVTWHEKPGIAVAEGNAYVIWTDFRNTQLSTTASPNDVFFAVEQ